MFNPSLSVQACAVLLVTCGQLLYAAVEPGTNALPYAVEQEMVGTMQGLKGERPFGHVGVTGLKLRIYDGMKITVEETVPGSPAAGKFKSGEVVTGVNGIALKGNNPFVVFGSALTKAEATDGTMVFEVQDAEGTTTKTVEVRIPVLGAYSATWPLNCAKSRAIITRAAEYYASTKKYADNNDAAKGDALASHGIGGALASLFLLSTGDDKYLPRVKEYIDHLAKDVTAIGDNTWNNGYNGILCAEYFLRTGDKAALPVLQYYCDNAHERQYYGVGWGHWGTTLNPGYVAGGLMNPAGAQIVTTLLLAKECGVNVDEPTLLGSLRQWYRFAGHGSVPYGDHRAEGGAGSNGKDGMAAAMMQAACGAKGDVGIYRQARDCFSKSMLDSYPGLVCGHGDNGRGDGIWRGIASAYMLDVKPHEYHAVMNHLRWWFDLSRRQTGGIGMALATWFDDEGSGAGLALAYTAPLKTLRITGAPQSKHATDFNLPESLWGRKADRAFLSIEHGTPHGKDEPIHVPLRLLGDAYNSGDAHALARLPLSEVLKNVYHARYMIRAEAAKALVRLGAFDELEKLLQDKDPRVRRAALDGLIDYRYWFAMGKNPIKTEQVTTAMVASIRRMLADKDEALYVVDGALMALSRAPASDIIAILPLIMPWTTNGEWWLRQSSFMALAGAGQDAAFHPQVLPTMLEMLTRETRTQARDGMQKQLASLWKTNKKNALTDTQISRGLQRTVKESEIKPTHPEAGMYNVIQAASAVLQGDPSSAVPVAEIIKDRFPQFESKQIAAVVGTLIPLCEKLTADKRAELTALLYGDYRSELIRRMEVNKNNALLDTILSLTQLKSSELGWQVVGKPALGERTWKFISFKPQPKDVLHPREGKRFRTVTLPAGLENWFQPGFDDAQWASGKAPIGTGVFTVKGGGKETIENKSAWGDGEFLLMRTTFEADPSAYDFYRIRVLANQGYAIYLNGQKIQTYIWWNKVPEYRAIGLGHDEVKHLKKGANVLAVYANAAYKDGGCIAQIDVYLEGLKNADLIGPTGAKKDPAARQRERKTATRADKPQQIQRGDLVGNMQLLNLWGDKPEAVQRLYESAYNLLAAKPDASFADLARDAAVQRLCTEAGVTHFGGPMLGSVRSDGATVWLRTLRPAKVEVRVTVNGQEKPFGPVASTEQSDLTAVVEISGLKPDTRYPYRVLIDGKPIHTGTAGTLRTSPAAGPAKARIAFGSCFHRWGLGNHRQAEALCQREPTALLVYGDIAAQDRDAHVGLHRADYLLRDFHPAWQRIAASVPVYATWDDHDYFNNDKWGLPKGCTEKDRQRVWETFRYAWNNPSYGFNDERRGVFLRTRVGPCDIIMVDNRYFRTAPTSTNDPGGNFLGPHQMDWLEQQLLDCKGPFIILSCGTMWSDYVTGGKDSWGSFDPQGREQIFSLIEKHRIPGVLLTSGDRHGARVFRIPRPSGYHFYEFEPASMGGRGDGPPAVIRNCDAQLFGIAGTYAFGEFSFDATLADPQVVFRLIEESGNSLYELKLSRLQLTPP